ncbi:hypothetical protein PQJ75_30615 [Rhodoplanes sp. TEM]|uniref:Uncharacterized protein n=1 Tax=Rhodoplanes tepidamans TaxID=200616 RepID=A0ABT5J5Z5_RHOTP|nr:MULTISPECIES: hypothetical protein [Rhodoplanes]MDC7784852.1 hypothetical protein [Rhodoplanes tepidamans]MDC7988103.1 hypothetical protein [Rhodoplanes sp. TEM]MDQ0353921.1 hypothetical protein [Rhodoplanes tepidamans]
MTEKLKIFAPSGREVRTAPAASPASADVDVAGLQRLIATRGTEAATRVGAAAAKVATQRREWDASAKTLLGKLGKS